MNDVLSGQLLFKTERLIIRRLKLSDDQFVFDLLNTEGFKANIADRNIDSLQKARAEITERYTPDYPDLGMFVVTLKPGHSITPQSSDLMTTKPISSEICLGCVTLIQRPYLSLPDVGYAFLPQFGGHGFAREAAKGLVEWAKAQGHSKLCAILLPDNHRSVNLIESIGFERIKVDEMGEPPEKQAYYEST